MKRRSFLTMLGLAPAVASSAKATPNDHLKDVVARADMAPGEVTRSWECPEFAERRAAAKEAGLPDPADGLTISLDRDQPVSDENPVGAPVFVAMENGRVVSKIWWVR